MEDSLFQSSIANFPTTAAAIPLATQPYQPVANYSGRGNKPRPLVAHINVYNVSSELQSESGTFPAKLVELPAGYAFEDTLIYSDSGRLRFTYGSQFAKRVVITDLKSGSYQLPPCEEARVEASVSSGLTQPFTNPCKVTGAFVEGWQGSPARPTFSWAGTMAAASTWGSTFPDGARWVQIWADETGPLPGTLSLRFEPLPFILLDYVNENFVPPVQPVEIGPKFKDAGWNLHCDGAGCTPQVRFFLEF